MLGSRPRGAAVVITGASDPPATLDSDGFVRGESAQTLAISTASLAGVLDHSRDDLTVTVAAGERVDALLDHVAAARQTLSVTPTGHATRSSVGGLVATAPPGPFDDAFGPLRRQLLGLRVVTFDGKIQRWGRAVVKNVAGYDVAKLHCGGFGQLGVIVDATFRLWPLPPAAVSYVIDEPRSLRVAERLAASDGPAQVDAISWEAWGDAEGPGGERLRVWLWGAPRAVEARVAALREFASGEGVELAEASRSGGPLLGDSGQEARERLRGLDTCVLRIRPTRSDLRQAMERLAALLAGRKHALAAYPGTACARVEYERSEPEAPSLFDSVSRALGRADLAVERGAPIEHKGSNARRSAGVRALERAILDSLGGQSRNWMADYL